MSPGPRLHEYAVQHLAVGEVVATGSGASVIGLSLIVYAWAKWKHWNPEAHKSFIIGVVAACLVGTGAGIFGSLGDSIRKTGDGVGTSVTTTTTGH